MGITLSKGTTAHVDTIGAVDVVITDANDSIKIGNGTYKADVTSASALKVDGSAVTQPVSGTLTADKTTRAVQIDAASSSVTYIGKAAVGTATSAASWQIAKLSVSGNVTSMTFANGATTFNQIWDNRASLSYS